VTGEGWVGINSMEGGLTGLEGCPHLAETNASEDGGVGEGDNMKKWSCVGEVKMGAEEVVDI